MAVQDSPPVPPNVATTGGKLTGSLGVGSIVFMVVAAAAPLTVISGTVPLGIAAGNGAAFPATYVVCTAILLLFAVGFTSMARHVPGAGAFYTYVERGLGRPVGLGTAFLALLSYTAVQGAVFGYIGAAVNDFVVSHGGPSVPWWVWSVGALAVVGVLGYRHIELSGKVLGILLVCEVGIVIVVDVAVMVQGGDAGMSTAMLSPGEFLSGAPGIAMIFALAGYIGFEATAIFRDEARDPARTIPRATYLSLVLIGGFYTISSWSVVSAWGDEGAITAATDNPEGMVVDTAARYVGAFTGDLVQVLLITSLFAALLSFHNVLSRYIFSLGNTAVLPKQCGRSHPKHSSPHVASVVQVATAGLLIGVSALAGLDPVTEVFAWFAGVSTVGIVALMLMTSVAVLVFFRRSRVDDRLWNTVIAPAAGLVGLAVMLYMTAANLPLLVGGSSTLAAVITVVLVATFLVGVALAVVRPPATVVEVTTQEEKK
ncbi:amino acid transporter [Rhodococcus sp. 27YEA15]|uniref:APC family permease n=1 Tax=Rhodococcus sp. 27YEA15 TaxID=3156259 RepID=UPI003C7D4864